MTQPDQPVVTHAVIIPHYNDCVRLTRCLTALAPQLIDGVEIVVADNASTEDLSQVKAQFPEVRFVTEPAKGASMARNCGVANTKAPGLIFLDADCMPGSSWLARACALDAKGAVFGGRVDVFDETPPPKSGAEAFETVFAFKQEDYIKKKGFSVTANLVTTRDVFEATGPFLTGVSEDVDWCRRAVAAGHELRYDDALVVSHPTRQDWPALRKKWLRLTQEMYGLNGTGARARMAWAVRALLMPLSVVIHAPRVLGSKQLSFEERLRCLTTLVRLRLARGGWMILQVLGFGR